MFGARLAGLLGLSVVIALVPAMGSAQETELKTFADWTLSCEADAGCRITTLAITEDASGPIDAVVLDDRADEEAVRGERLSDERLGFLVRSAVVDETKPLVATVRGVPAVQLAPFTAYRPVGSADALYVVDADAKAALLDAFKRGLVLTLAFVTRSGEERALTFSLEGFSASYARLTRPDPAARTARRAIGEERAPSPRERPQAGPDSPDGTDEPTVQAAIDPVPLPVPPVQERLAPLVAPIPAQPLGRAGERELVQACEAFAEGFLKSRLGDFVSVALAREEGIDVQTFKDYVGAQFIDHLVRGQGRLVRKGTGEQDVRFVCLTGGPGKGAEFFHYEIRRDVTPLERCDREQTGGGTQLTSCLEELKSVADADLAAVEFKARQALGSGDGSKRLEASQKAWRDFRHAECSRRAAASSKAAEPEVYLACQVELTFERASVLAPG